MDMDFSKLRRKMVYQQLIARGITDDDVLSAMALVPRERFVSEEWIRHSYEDTPLPIDCGQTISQPFIVAFMLDKLKLKPTDRVLEIGTGSGYNAAVLSEIVSEVYSVEIIKALADDAREKIEHMGYYNIMVKHADGYDGWQEHAPYDAMVVTAAPKAIPFKLFDQLADGGKIIAPIGDYNQCLMIYHKHEGKIIEQDLIPVRFVPMVDVQYLIDKEIINRPEL